MKALAMVVLLTCAADARAQGNGAGLDGIGMAYLAGAVGVSVFASSVVTGVGSFHEGRLRTLGWATWSSAVLGLGALGTGIGMLGWGAKELRYSGGVGLLMAGTLIIGQGLRNIGTPVCSFVRRGQAYPSPAPPYAHGMCMPIPSVRLISACRRAQLPNAPMAHMVMTCHNPPSRIGASMRPYLRSGGAIEICHKFHVGPIAAPHTHNIVPRTTKKIVVTPKKPT